MTALAIPGLAHAGQEQYTSGDLTYVTQSKAMPEGEVTTARAKCPEGTRLTGGGAGVFGKSLTQYERLSAALPVDTAADLDTERDDAFKSVVLNVSKFNRDLGNTAICLEAGNLGLTYPILQQEYTGGAETGADVDCAPETAVVGGGVGWSGRPVHNEFVRAPSPFVFGSRPLQQSWAGNANLQQNAGTRTLTVSAVCLAAGIGDVELKTKTKEMSAEGGTLKVPCSPGYRVTGGGESGSAVQSQPYDSGDPGKAPDDGWKLRVARSSQPSSATVSALCFKPVA